jgi:hypothetical protein
MSPVYKNAQDMNISFIAAAAFCHVIRKRSGQGIGGEAVPKIDEVVGYLTVLSSVGASVAQA